MTPDRIGVEKLPGRRRGIINGASAWLGPDYILLVKSQRFTEDYKRYHLRDIQAIAVARTSSFHVSSRALAVGVLWGIALLVSLRIPNMTPWVWLSAIVLAGAWVYVSADRSCVCRIYTAVSSDRLPSVYRTWTARRFLAMVEPRIREVQGEIDPGWIEAVEQRAVGPEAVRDSVRANPPLPGSAPSTLSITDSAHAAEAREVPTGSARTLASDLFLAAMLLQAGAGVLAFSKGSAVVTWIIVGLVLAQIAAAIFLFVDRSRGRLRSPVHKVAIAKLIWVSLMFYVSGIATSRGGTPADLTVQLAPDNAILRGIDVALSIALAAAGLLLTYRPEPRPPTTLLGS